MGQQRVAADIAIQPGRPEAEGALIDKYGHPRVLIVDPQGDPDDNVLERGRKIVLRGTWTLRQYRNPVPCGAQFTLLPGPDATYEWEVQHDPD